MSDRLHVLFLNSWYPSRVLPTNGDFIQRHAEAVATRYRVSCIHAITDPDLKGGVKITDDIIAGVRTIIAYIPPVANPLIKSYRFISAYRRMMTMVGGFDIIHVHRTFPAGVGAYLLRLLKGIPYIITEHWTGYRPGSRHALTSSERFWARRIIKRAFRVCPVSKDLALSMQQLGFKGEYESVPNVVKTDLFNIRGKTAGSASFEILHVSSLIDEHKNITGLLHGVAPFLAKYPNARLTIIGDRPERYAPQIQSLELAPTRIRLIDQMPQEQLAEYMRSADVFVLFSREENLPCVILESFASGTPVVSSDVGGIKEYFPDNFGRLVPSGDQVALFTALEEVIRAETGFAKPEEMLDYVWRHFSPGAIASAYGKIYKQALRNNDR